MSERIPPHNFYKNGQKLRTDLSPLFTRQEDPQSAHADLSQEIQIRLPH